MSEKYCCKSGRTELNSRPHVSLVVCVLKGGVLIPGLSGLTRGKFYTSPPCPWLPVMCTYLYPGLSGQREMFWFLLQRVDLRNVQHEGKKWKGQFHMRPDDLSGHFPQMTWPWLQLSLFLWLSSLRVSTFHIKQVNNFSEFGPQSGICSTPKPSTFCLLSSHFGGCYWQTDPKACVFPGLPFWSMWCFLEGNMSQL